MNWCWHKWETVTKLTNGVFLDVGYTYNGDTGFRRCSKCKRVQEYAYDSQGGSWSDLTETQLLIFNRKFGYINEK